MNRSKRRLIPIVDRGFQFKYTGIIMGVAAVISTVLGWFLLGKNVVLTGGLVFSEAARARYAANGSFGLTNDYLRLSHELLGWPLEAVGLLMSLAALAVLPSLWILVRVQSGRFHLLNR